MVFRIRPETPSESQLYHKRVLASGYVVCNFEIHTIVAMSDLFLKATNLKCNI